MNKSQWHHWLKRINHISGTIALTAGRDLPLAEFVKELRSIADEMELATQELTNAN